MPMRTFLIDWPRACWEPPDSTDRGTCGLDRSEHPKGLKRRLAVPAFLATTDFYGAKSHNFYYFNKNSFSPSSILKHKTLRNTTVSRILEIPTECERGRKMKSNAVSSAIPTLGRQRQKSFHDLGDQPGLHSKTVSKTNGHQSTVNARVFSVRVARHGGANPNPALECRRLPASSRPISTARASKGYVASKTQRQERKQHKKVNSLS